MQKGLVFVSLFLGVVITVIILGGFLLVENSLAASTADIIYVDADNGSGTYNGTWWTSAFTNVQDALTEAISGTQVWVAEGIYYPDEGIDQSDDARDSTFILREGVEIYGGFDPDNLADTFGERDWAAYPTVLSGDIDHETTPDITDPIGVVTSSANINGDNGFNVVLCEGSSDRSVLEGFIITAGNANGSGWQQYGGGMHNKSASSPTLTNLSFSGNSAYNGGGMYNQGSNPILNNITFSGNSADYGGGMFNTSSNPTLTNIKYLGNSATSFGGGIYNFTSDTPLTNVIFSGNSAVSRGGGMYNNNDSHPVLTNVTFSSNTSADLGGGMFNNNSHLTMTNTILWGNTAGTDGDQIYNSASTPLVSFSDIQGSGGSTSWDTTLGTDGGNNIETDPIFVRDPDPGDGDWSTPNDNDYGDLHLTLVSPANNTGTNAGCPATDIEGIIRPQNNTCDMGAYEVPYGGVLYVDADATGSAIGVSWTDAFTNVQDALAVAIDGYQVWVAEGVYYPDVGTGQTDNSRSSTFELQGGIAIIGGFDPGVGADEYNERDADTYKTVLSGDIDYNDITDPDGVVTTTANINGANAYHVVSSKGVTDTFWLRGFTITAGQADGTEDDDKGGGMFIDLVYHRLLELTFSGNEAVYGGGLYIDTSNPELIDVIFSGNSATNGGGLFNNTSSPELNAVTFSGNSASTGGGIYNFANANPTLTDVTFLENSATNGGGMYNDTSDPKLNRVMLFGNSALLGGGIFNSGSLNSTMTSVIFSGNSAIYGGGMYNNGSSSPTLTNVTFSSNNADHGGGIYNDAGSISTLANVVLWGNSASSGDQIENNFPLSANAIISYSDIQGSGGSTSWDTSLGSDGGNNVDTDPIFVRNPDPGDGDWSTHADNDYGDLHLQLDSPVINAGTNTGCTNIRDIDEFQRPDGPYCDIGADEYFYERFYVDADAVGNATGVSWTHAFTNVQDGLACKYREIWVAEGVYYPDEGFGQTNDDRTSDFDLWYGDLYGGFDPGSGADLFEERDWEAYPTVLSGDIDHETNPDTTDPDGVVTTTANISGTNAYHVVSTSFNVEYWTTLDGFIITAGEADGTGEDIYGGGMYTLGNPTLENLTFSGNAGFNGGGLYNDSDHRLSLTNVTFSHNLASSAGGGMYTERDTVTTLINVVFSGNSADFWGGGMYNNSYWATTLNTVTFSGNSAEYGGGMYSDGDDNTTLTNVNFINNLAHRGGGMMSFMSFIKLDNVTFSGNTASKGGAFYAWETSPSLTNVTLSGNSASSGGGIYNESGYSWILKNAIIWGNTANSGDQIETDIWIFPPRLTINYSDIQGSGSSTSWDTNLGIDGGGNIDADPLFVRNPDPGDGDWSTLGDNDYGDLHLQVGSPAINSGTNTGCPVADMDGVLRPQAGVCDMGAYERESTVPNGLLVDHEAPGPGHNGLTWTTAFTNVQDALTIAISGTQIWVAEGVYYPDEGIGQINDSVTSTFVLTGWISIYGGFDPGSGADLFEERDWTAYPTVLSGDIDHETLPDSTNPYGVVTSTEFITGTNAYHVVTSSYVTGTTVVDGFVITAGQANGPASSQKRGGGLWNYHSDLTLNNLIFSGNSASANGGGMHNRTGNPSLTNVIFAGNSADNGGGMTNYLGGNPSLINVTFSGNSALTSGGGIYNIDGSNPILTNTILWGNTAGVSGDQIYNDSSIPIISTCDIQGSGGSSTWDTSLGTDSGGNIDNDPLFISTYDDLHLQPNSPAINTGTNTGCPSFDLDGISRPQGGTCDMGAYEFYVYLVYLPLIMR